MKEIQRMRMIFGTNSKAAANTRLTNGYYLYDWVMRKNCFPAFWGRPITGIHQIIEEELTFLRDRKCKVALLISDLDEISVSKTNGVQDAIRAVEAAKALGVPRNAGIALFAEIAPDWSINHNWMLSFAATLRANGYVPGFIGNTDSSKNCSFDRQCSHYVQAILASQGTEVYDTAFWATEPKIDMEPDKWVPYCPTGLMQEDIDLWQIGETTINEISAQQIYARDSAVLKYMW